MNGQMDLFDFIAVRPKPGDWVEETLIGRELTFDEITLRKGQLIVYDMSTISHKWYKVVKVEDIFLKINESRRLIYYDGKKQRGLVDEIYFNSEQLHPARAYELKHSS